MWEARPPFERHTLEQIEHLCPNRLVFFAALGSGDNGGGVDAPVVSTRSVTMDNVAGSDGFVGVLDETSSKFRAVESLEDSGGVGGPVRSAWRVAVDLAGVIIEMSPMLPGVRVLSFEESEMSSIVSSSVVL